MPLSHVVAMVLCDSGDLIDHHKHLGMNDLSFQIFKEYWVPSHIAGRTTNGYYHVIHMLVYIFLVIKNIHKFRTAIGKLL